MQEAGVCFVNAWGSVKSAGQIYNAARKEKLLSKAWQDMELAVILHGRPGIFVGNAPNNVEEAFKCWSLSLGYSAQNFAQGGRRTHSAALTSSQGPRGLIEEKIMSPIAYELRFGYTTTRPSSGKSASDLETVLQMCIEQSDDPSAANILVNVPSQRPNKRHQKQKRCTPPEALILICQSIMGEELALTFDHFRLHRSAWRVLRAINEENENDLKRIYGPGYLERENQLPFLAGYIFMTAVQIKKLAGILLPKKENIVSSKLLMQAAQTVEGLIENGMGGLETNVLREQYGMDIEIGREYQL
jgi:hypothetical protein